MFCISDVHTTVKNKDIAVNLWGGGWVGKRACLPGDAVCATLRQQHNFFDYLILGPLESFLCPVKFITSVCSFTVQRYLLQLTARKETKLNPASLITKVTCL